MENGGRVKGSFPFVLTPMQAQTAVLVSDFYCPPSQNPGLPCHVNVKMSVEHQGIEMGGIQSQLQNGQLLFLQLELFAVQAVLDGKPFNVVLNVDVGAEANQNDVAYFINPRIMSL